MRNDYIQHRLDDLKSDREQLQYWLHKVNEEIKELEDARDKQDTLGRLFRADEGNT